MKWRSRSRARFVALADQLTFPQPFELAEFCRRIAERRGRPLRLVPLEGAVADELPCGMWLGLDSVDLVFYEAGAAPILKTQIVLHEISHMLLDHVSPQGPAAALRAEAARVRAVQDAVRAAEQSAARAEDEELGLSTDRVLSLLARSGYSSRQETEAESLATLILERATRAETNPASPDSAEVLNRLNDAFGHPVRSI
ncbi:hypothetical protein P3T36_004967 [Kitasatospora sp. MAP12-15]|uniref:hypothetical protein n=1 Tax=unclassified Kitasatospora TaxID=2633591 RepID=UPI0024731E1F|nr:hypothetical protein [Kitasatospora sp. MAP12-44]MDH6112056.1 hypothetical protein [Kitasatospora sp. MAP12-44]